MYCAVTTLRSASAEMGDRQVLIAILLTVVLVIGLAFTTRTPESTAGPQLLWRDPPPSKSGTLQI